MTSAAIFADEPAPGLPSGPGYQLSDAPLSLGTAIAGLAEQLIALTRQLAAQNDLLIQLVAHNQALIEMLASRDENAEEGEERSISSQQPNQAAQIPPESYR